MIHDIARLTVFHGFSPQTGDSRNLEPLIRHQHVPSLRTETYALARRGWIAGDGWNVWDKREMRKSFRGLGFANRKPCPLSKPRSTRHRKSSIVSMPSAQVEASKRWARSATVWQRPRLRESDAQPVTKLRSSLISPKGKSFTRDSDE